MWQFCFPALVLICSVFSRGTFVCLLGSFDPGTERIATAKKLSQLPIEQLKQQLGRVVSTLQDSEPEVRRYGVLAVERLGPFGAPVVDDVVRAYWKEHDERTRTQMESALGKIGLPALRHFAKVLATKEESQTRRLISLYVLGSFRNNPDDAVRALEVALKDKSSEIQFVAAEQIVSLDRNHDAAIGVLVRYLENPPEQPLNTPNYSVSALVALARTKARNKTIPYFEDDLRQILSEGGKVTLFFVNTCILMSNLGEDGKQLVPLLEKVFQNKDNEGIRVWIGSAMIIMDPKNAT